MNIERGVRYNRERRKWNMRDRNLNLEFLSFNNVLLWRLNNIINSFSINVQIVP